MAVMHDKHGDKDRKSHIGEIKHRLAEMSGGHIVAGGTEVLPIEEQEKFWCRVMAFENGPFTTNFERLIKAGVDLPQPRSMNDDELTAKLSEVIHSLSRMRILHQPDGPSERPRVVFAPVVGIAP